MIVAVIILTALTFGTGLMCGVIMERDRYRAPTPTISPRIAIPTAWRIKHDRR